ncbi:MAG: SUMF1/EgtB/PvdO family nonheme iron enzyme, partial [Bacteroidota bacterium]
KVYLEHPAYDDYPVVNVSYEGALLYCAWLTQQLHTQFPGEYDNYHFRLPAKEEFTYAAQAGHEFAPYPWGGFYLQNARGQKLANFNAIGSESIARDPETGELELVKNHKLPPKVDEFSVLAPAVSYVENDFGAYNMCGNAAEMTLEKGLAMGGSWRSPGYDIRVFSEMPYDEPNPEVGFRPVLALSANNF